MNVLLPFLFAFVVIFGILEKTKVFGTENGKTKKNINAMTAFVISFIFISFGTYVQNLVTYLQILAMILIFIMGLAYAFALFTLDMTIFSKKTFFTMTLFVIAIIAFFYSIGLLNGIPGGFILDLVLNPVVLIVLFFFGIIWFMTSGNGSGGVSNSNNGSSSSSNSNQSEKGIFDDIPNRDVLDPKAVGKMPKKRN